MAVQASAAIHPETSIAEISNLSAMVIEILFGYSS
jgi:hypothetical protein